MNRWLLYALILACFMWAGIWAFVDLVLSAL